jgi:salicylate hydroxylase
MSADRLRVAIVGGETTDAAANALSQRGVDVCVYEQAEHLTEVGAGLGLAPNGMRILRRLSLGETIEVRGSQWTDEQYCRPDGTAVAQMLPLSPPIDYFGMHRADLLDVLLANLPGDIVWFGHRCIGFEQDEEQAAVVFARHRQQAQDAEHMRGTRHAAASHLTARRKAGSLPAGNP